MDGQNDAALQPPRLSGRRRFEGFAMGSKPGLEDTVAAHTGVDAARNRFYLGQFRHPPIVEDTRDEYGGGE